MPQEKDNKPKGEAMEEEGQKDIKALDEKDINILKRYGMGPYSQKIAKLEEDNKNQIENINKLVGIKESDIGLALPSQWNLAQDQQLRGEDALQVAKCTKIINPRTENAKYMINLRQIAKFVVGLGKDVTPTDIEEDMRVAVERHKYTI